MKKFKNSLYVEGSQPLLKAFASELDNLGWEYNSRMNATCHPNSFEEGVNTLFIDNIKGYYGQNYNSDKASINNKTLSILRLPQDWNKAIQLASEVEEEVPEYVKITKGSGWYTDKIGLILKVVKLYKDIYYSVEHDNTTETFLVAIDECTKSSKAEYDAQELEFKKKELLEEAKRRGYKEGIKIILIKGKIGETSCSLGDRFRYYDKEDELVLEDSRSINTIYCKGQWATIIEDEFKVGEYLYFNGNDSNNAPKGSIAIVTKPIHFHKQHNCNYVGIKWIYKGNTNQSDGNYYPTDFRRAKPEEFNKYIEDTIEIAGYKAEVKNYRIAFGCKEFTAEDLKAIKRVNELSKLKSIDFNFNGADTILVYDDEEYTVSDKVLDKLIDKIPQF